jgi:hypothetical protein
MYFEQYLCQTCHTLFIGGQDRQELFIHVEVRSPDSNFDPQKIFLCNSIKLRVKNFNFGIIKTLILHTRPIFLQGGHLKKYGVKKYFSWKTLSKLGALTAFIYWHTLLISLHSMHSNILSPAPRFFYNRFSYCFRISGETTTFACVIVYSINFILLIPRTSILPVYTLFWCESCCLTIWGIYNYLFINS